ncbi:MAG: DUF6335 family protein [Acidobacteriota bacterium]|jgi:hypothetical protein|nr:DUF6335 family protein [Acidobacteriota bacterium]
MSGKELEFYENQPVPDKDVQELMEEEIEHAPKAPGELKERLAEHNSTSPALSGGDIDAEWEDANDSGAESVGGHNPTPDQSDSEANAKAMGVSFEDNEPLNFDEKHERKDRFRDELKESSKDK